MNSIEKSYFSGAEVSVSEASKVVAVRNRRGEVVYETAWVTGAPRKGRPGKLEMLIIYLKNVPVACGIESR